MEAKTLLAEARRARECAYAPYSGFAVGAALLCENGKIYTGANVENASYGATMCAERTALFRAVTEGERAFSALAIVGGRIGEETVLCPPCGMCRQVLSEFCGSELPIYLEGAEGVQTTTLGTLLPFAFDSGVM